MKSRYLNDDPDLCVCRGTGEFWGVGEPGQCIILNVFPPYRRKDGTLVAPDFDGLDQMLVPCVKHCIKGLSFHDIELIEACGIALPNELIG